MDAKRLGRRIKSYRKLKRYTQKRFADKLDMPIGLLGALERGTKEASDDVIDQIAAALQIDKHELLDLEQNKEND